MGGVIATALPVAETFGPTIQGEGPHAGRACWFVRLGGCNLSCTWCDSAYTWDGSRYDLRAELPMTTVEAVLDRLPPDPGIVILTGGEPLLHQNGQAFEALLAALARVADVHVETNGTIEPTWRTCAHVAQFVVSPKLDHAGPHRGHQDPTPWSGWWKVEHAVVKYVVQTVIDVDIAVTAALLAGWDRHRIWVMPEGTTAEVLGQRWPAIAQAAADHGINASHRLHVLAWGSDRGH